MVDAGLQQRLQDAYNAGFKAGQESMASRLMEWVQGGGCETMIKTGDDTTLNKRTVLFEGEKCLLRYAVVENKADGTEQE